MKFLLVFIQNRIAAQKNSDETAKLHHVIDELKKANKDLASKYKEARQNVSLFLGETKRQTNANRDLSDKVKDLQEANIKIVQYVKDIQQLRDENQRLKDQKHVMSTEHTRSLEQMIQLELEIKHLREADTTFRIVSKKYHDNAIKLHASIDTLKKTNEALSKKLKDLEQRRTSGTLTQEIDALRLNLSDVNGANVRLREASASLEAENRSLKNTIDTCLYTIKILSLQTGRKESGFIKDFAGHFNECLFELTRADKADEQSIAWLHEANDFHNEQERAKLNQMALDFERSVQHFSGGASSSRGGRSALRGGRSTSHRGGRASRGNNRRR